jgi:hypothetical protein
MEALFAIDNCRKQLNRENGILKITNTIVMIWIKNNFKGSCAEGLVSSWGHYLDVIV